MKLKINCDGTALAWDSSTVEFLTGIKLLGCMIGTRFDKPMQNTGLTFPMRYFKEQVRLLKHLGFNNDNKELELCTAKSLDLNENLSSFNDYSCEFNNALLPRTSSTDSKFKVFHEFWKKGYWVTQAAKYGGDFLIYDTNPSQSHAKFIVSVTSGNVDNLEVLCLVRLATAVNKIAIFCWWNLEQDRMSSRTVIWNGSHIEDINLII